MYGALTYGQTAYAGLGVYAEGIVGAVSITLVVEASITSAYGNNCVVDLTLSPVVMVGADQSNRTSTVVVESGIAVILTSTIPTYAVGLINPVLSVFMAGNTTVRCTSSISITQRVVIYAIHSSPFKSNIIVKPRVSIIAAGVPVGVADAHPVVIVSATLIVVTHARSIVTIPAYVSSTMRTGFVSHASATIPLTLSAICSSPIGSTMSVTPVVSVISSLYRGVSAVSSVTAPVQVSVIAGAFSNIHISGAITTTVYPYIRGSFNDNSYYADYAYVLTKQNSVSVFQ